MAKDKLHSFSGYSSLGRELVPWSTDKWEIRGEARPKGSLTACSCKPSALKKLGLRSPTPLFSIKTDIYILLYTQSNNSMYLLRLGRLQRNYGLLPAFSYPPVRVTPSDKIQVVFEQVKSFSIFF